MLDLPLYITILFGATTLASIYWFYKASRSKSFLFGLVIWAILQSVLAYLGVYQNTEAIPPRIMLFGIFPTLLFMLGTFFTKRGKAFIESIDLKTLTYFHSIRIPVEIVLSLLFHYGAMSVYATFEGTNFDILSGLSAPIVAYLAFKTGKQNRKLLLAWNIICLLLLLNVLVTAVFAFPSPFQKLAFDQPNIAPLYFPFNLLPTLVVPLVMFGHFIAIKRLLK